MSDPKFPHLPNPQFKPGDKVTYFSTVTRLTSLQGTVMDEGRLTRDESTDPDGLVYRVYKVKLASSPSFPPGAGVGSPWPEDSMLHGWLPITDPAHSESVALKTIRSWTYGLITLDELAGELQKIADARTCPWQTSYGTGLGDTICGNRLAGEDPYCPEHMQDLNENYPDDHRRLTRS